IEVLAWHGAPRGFVDVVANTGVRLAGSASDAQHALSAGLEGVLHFAPIQTQLDKSLLIVGPPGGGKTSVVAKLTSRAIHDEIDLEPIAADFDHSGDAARLAAFTKRADLRRTRTPKDLTTLLDACDRLEKRIVVDGPGFNPVDPEDMDRLKDLVMMLNVEPVLALSAEGHPEDLQDTVRAFANIGVKRAIITKLDAIRRRGGVISALSSARLSLAQLGMTPFIGGGLVPASPVRLARLLLETAPESVTGAAPLKGAA
ncbi:MAG: GTP-binding protein, partial [Pseudomonadota bacterium]